MKKTQPPNRIDMLIQGADLLKMGKDLNRREKFALAAMQGMLSCGDQNKYDLPETLVNRAVHFADLLEAKLDATQKKEP